MDNFKNWKYELHKNFKITMYGCDDDIEYQKASDNFDKALREALEANKSEYAQELISLFCDDEDYGTLESCFRILSNMDKEQLILAFNASENALRKHSQFWYDEIRSLLP